MKKKHRNSQKRIYFEDAIYFVTTNTKNWFPFFKEKIFCDLFVENLRVCKKLKGFWLYAWFLGYDHFHLLLKPNDDFNISAVIHNLKRVTSLQINQILEGEDIYPRLRYEWTTKLMNFRNQFIKKHGSKHYFPHFQWQSSYYDHIIRNDKDFEKHWAYTKWNPVKHKLPENWPYVFTNSKYEDLIDYIDL